MASFTNSHDLRGDGLHNDPTLLSRSVRFQLSDRDNMGERLRQINSKIKESEQRLKNCVDQFHSLDQGQTSLNFNSQVHDPVSFTTSTPRVRNTHASLSQNQSVPDNQASLDMSSLSLNNTQQNTSSFIPASSTSQIHPLTRREKEPEKFDGKSCDWKDFIVQFEYVAEWNRWSYREMAQQLVMCLRGTAQKLLGDLPQDQLSDYAKLKSILNNRFNPQERESAYRCEFRSRRRQKGESPTDYGYALRRLGCLAFPDIPSNWREPFIIDQFITGVGTPDLRKHISFKHPKTIDSAIALAVEFEAFEGCPGLRKPTVSFEDELPKSTNALVESVQRSPIKEKSNSATKSELASLENSIKECMDKITQLTEEVKSSRSFERKKYCKFCKTNDHNTFHCPNKPSKQNGSNEDKDKKSGN
ncbi:hypothetical protein FSP39_023762 [Pinctada imbricata]|uniref:Retrotransposon gag domain-containing protein n=1 Tax=Pinctada imbricata TaxID=66713 RepID=A0AA88XUY6_PINIB|nr:hypothetical protein FSP39_023762 [Pinctada imbricata]